MKITPALWLRQHSAGARRLAAALTAYFDDQTRRIIVALRDFAQPTPGIVPQLLDTSTELERLIQTVEPHLVALGLMVALTELELHGEAERWPDAGDRAPE